MVQISRQNIEMRLTCERPWVKVFTFTNVETIRFLWAVREWACNWIGRKNFLTTKRRSRSRVVPANARLFGALGASPLTTRAGIAYRLLRYLAVNGKKPRERDRERERERGAEETVQFGARGFRKRSRFSFLATTVPNWPYSAGCPLYLMKKKMQNIKKVYFCTK